VLLDDLVAGGLLGMAAAIGEPHIFNLESISNSAHEVPGLARYRKAHLTTPFQLLGLF
jgi:hypothetical protein